MRRVAERLHQEPHWGEHDEFSRDLSPRPRSHASLWHAVALMTAAHWRDPLATRRFTDGTSIVGAVVHALESDRMRGEGPLAVKDARAVLLAIGAAEPTDWSTGTLLGDGLRPSCIVERHHCTGKVQRDEWVMN